ncbi:MAG: HPr family phosphocarrier protein [Candidatus Omnitrophica bacterium]|nr:HPr family phosphocarrier protein [Candidatus Omnitrophota bacterium]MBU1127648.1 HPr family phosphocarrier protein [Candidatus Omnitrophota bacterium]MBU1656684.1 HPr family phosphocarrier protein [Candidatus Omnitrophota bacterium]MBU1784937.1 HPr family phosphocarrier protein [Candidatus Omnitrophota bacterium]MBU1851966.1 HPr family phosphocarrier protein [Candidatus Omnitrophota bacterium]
MVEKKITIRNETGLHARPAALFVRIANKFESAITIAKDDQTVNGKSIMGILMLAAEKGARISIIADGNDAEKAVDELSEILSQDIESNELGQVK